MNEQCSPRPVSTEILLLSSLIFSELSRRSINKRMLHSFAPSYLGLEVDESLSFVEFRQN